MRRKRVWIVLLTIMLITALAFIIFYSTNYSYATNEGDTFDLTVGETVSIELHENGSTGFSNCWVNEHNSTTVILVNEKYNSSISERFGSIGSGGSITLTFQAVRAGTDTVKVSKCPTGRMQKDCSFFASDSARYLSGDSILSQYEPFRKADHVFVFNVSN